METHKIGLFFFLSFYFVLSNALECHNCYGNTRDLKDCRPLSYEELSAKLRWSRQQDERRIPPLTVTRYSPDACIKFETEFVDERGRRELAVVRTQINRASSSLFTHDAYISEYCYLKNEGSVTTNGVTITRTFCGCNGDYCNGGISNRGQFSIFLVVTSLIVAMRFGLA